MEHPGSWHWTPPGGTGLHLVALDSTWWHVPPGGMGYQDAGEGGGTPKHFLKVGVRHVPENIENLKISCISV